MKAVICLKIVSIGSFPNTEYVCMELSTFLCGLLYMCCMELSCF